MHKCGSVCGYVIRISTLMCYKVGDDPEIAVKPADLSSERIRVHFPAGYKVLKCRDYSGEYRLEQNISREKGCGEEVAAKCLQFIKVL